MNKHQLFIIPMTIFLLFVSAHPAHSEELSLTVNPSKIFISTTTSTPYTQSISLSNNKKQDITLQIEKKAFLVENNGNIIIINPDKNFSQLLSGNIIIKDGDEATSTVLLEQNSTKIIKVNIKTPKNIKNNDLKFGLLITTQNNSNSIKSSAKGIFALSQIETGIFIPIVITSPSETPAGSIISNFTTSPLTPSTRPSFSITLSNSGQQAISTNTELLVSDIFGRVVDKVSIDNKILLSKSVNTITNPGKISLSTNTNLILGPHKATLRTKILGTNYIEEKFIYLFVIQLKEISYIIIGLTFLLFVNYRIKRKRE